MRLKVLFACAALSWVTAVVYAQYSAPPAAPDGYVGSKACQSCHDGEYDSWRQTLHIQMTKPIGEAKVEGDFRPGTHVEQNGRAYTVESKNGQYFISVSHDGRPAEKFKVDYTLGARRFQGYLSTLPDGRIYVLPLFWHNESKRWLDWKEITPVPEHPTQDLRQIWNITCVNCHATNLAKNYNPKTRTYATKWTELGPGCEACHGPGAAHVAVAQEWDKDPVHAPINPSAAELRIFSPAKATARQTFDACGYCHGNKNNVFFGFKPGDRYEDFALPFLISDPYPENDPQGEFWPDGRPSRFNRPQALTLSGCFRSGQATCTNCHRMHGPENAHMLKVAVEAPDGSHTRESDSLCTQCHKALANDSSHTHHAPESSGSRCIECHMSDVNWRLITRRRDHSFQPPVPELTARYGVPNACTTCHEDKAPEWASATMDRWYANRDRRLATVAMADALYAAEAGDASSLAAMGRLAADRSHGAVIRASAAEFAGQLITSAARAGGTAPVEAAVVNELVGAANDPEAMVRATAIRSLGAVVDDRTTAVIAAHLTDSARVVRTRAAAALLDRGIARLEGPVGAALTRAQDEWAESLRTFNDVARDQSRLGWLELSRGHASEAVDALNTAIEIDPSDAQPHVYLGVMAARAGHFEDAVKEFTAARSLQPDYPNLNRLIDEAQKRR